MHSILCLAFQLYFIALFARIILSWFPISPDSPMASAFSFLYSITEPVLGPVRRLMPSMGVIDLSPIIVFVGLEVVARLFGCGIGL
jgi:YggT family protein